MMTPEQQVRQKIDALLVAAGWIIQDMKDFNRNAALEDIDSLPAPSIIAAEIVENLEAALEQFRSVAEELNGKAA
jgi:hypothetical protein